MRNFFSTITILLALAFVLPAIASDIPESHEDDQAQAPSNRLPQEIVRIPVDDQELVGTLTMPDRALPPVVLMLHGFTGGRDEMTIKHVGEGIFERTAQTLARHGYATLRIDMRGTGDSDGEWADTTFTRQIEDAVAAIDWLAHHDLVNTNRIAVMGWSQGGLVALHAAVERQSVATAILWAPVVNPMISYRRFLGEDAISAGLTAEPDTVIEAETHWGLEVNLRAQFYQEMALVSTPAAAAQFDRPLKVIVAEHDTAITPQPEAGEVLLRYHEGEGSLTMFPTDHVWGAFQGASTLDEMVIPSTLDWLDRHL